MAERDDRKPLLFAGIGLLGLAGWQLLQRSAPAGSPPPTTTTPPSSGAPLPFSAWLKACRPDIVQGLNDGRYRDVIGQYSREAYPAFWSRSDITDAVGQARWTDIVGQFLREYAPGFIARTDIQLGILQGRWGDVFGQFCRESGALTCVGAIVVPTQGNPAPAPARSGQGPGGSPGTGVSAGSGSGTGSLAGTGGGKAPIGRWQDVRAGMLISTRCSPGAGDYLVVNTGKVDYPGHLQIARRWIADWPSYQFLTGGNSRAPIVLVTPACLNAIQPDAALKMLTLTSHGVVVGRVWQDYSSPTVNKSAAGYCG